MCTRQWGHLLAPIRLYYFLSASLGAQLVKNLPVMQETWVQSLGWEDPLEKGTATHSSILAWRIPWTEETVGLQSVRLQRVRHDFHFHFSLSPVAQTVKNPLAMQETWVWSLGRKDPLEKGMATHFSILAWRIPWTEEPGRLWSIELHRVRHDWETKSFNDPKTVKNCCSKKVNLLCSSSLRSRALCVQTKNHSQLPGALPADRVYAMALWNLCLPLQKWAALSPRFFWNTVTFHPQKTGFYKSRHAVTLLEEGVAAGAFSGTEGACGLPRGPRAAFCCWLAPGKEGSSLHRAECAT